MERRKSIRKIFSILLVVLMVLSSVPIMSLAWDGDLSMEEHNFDGHKGYIFYRGTDFIDMKIMEADENGVINVEVGKPFSIELNCGRWLSGTGIDTARSTFGWHYGDGTGYTLNSTSHNQTISYWNAQYNGANVQSAVRGTMANQLKTSEGNIDLRAGNNNGGTQRDATGIYDFTTASFPQLNTVGTYTLNLNATFTMAKWTWYITGSKWAAIYGISPTIPVTIRVYDPNATQDFDFVNNAGNVVKTVSGKDYSSIYNERPTENTAPSYASNNNTTHNKITYSWPTAIGYEKGFVTGNSALIYDSNDARISSGKIVICSDGKRENTTAGILSFPISSFPSSVYKATLKLNYSNYGFDGEKLNVVQIFDNKEITSNNKNDKINDVFKSYESGTRTSYNNALSYFEVSENNLVESIGITIGEGSHDVSIDITNIIKEAKINRQNNIMFLLIIPNSGNNGSNGWSDITVSPKDCNISWDNVGSDNHIKIQEVATSSIEFCAMNEGSVTKQPTCTETGIRLKSCTYCGYAKEEIENTTSHTLTKIEKVDPTCYTDGNIEYYKCSECNKCFNNSNATVEIAENSTVITKTGNHVWDDGEITLEPKCTVTGIKKYNCTTEGCTATKEEVIDPNGHKWTDSSIIEATCTADGYTLEICMTCGITQIKSGSIVPASHILTKVDAVAETCTDDGNIEYWVCTRNDCNKLFDNENATNEITLEDVIVESTGHAYGEFESNDDATCAVDGTKTAICSKCGDILTVTDEGSKKNHTLDEGQITILSTCVNKGTKIYTCIDCNQVIETVEVELDPSNHANVVMDEATDSTCITHGLTEGSHCEACGTTILAQEEKELADHTWNEGVVTTPANCVETGIKTYTCTVEGCEATKTETILIDKTNHKNAVVDEAVESTCYSTGLTAGSHCEACGDVITAQEVTEKKAHTWNEGVVTTPANCVETGIKTYTCTVEGCGATKTETILIDKTNHKNVIADEAVESTCYSTGLTAGSHCEACGDVITAQEVTEKKAHTWNEGVVTTPANCVETGIKIYTCIVEGCGATKTETVGIDVNNHKNIVIDEETFSNCTDHGYTQGSHCEYCNTVIVEQIEKELADHVLMDAVVENDTPSTCFEKGGYDSVVYCSRCENEVTRDHIEYELLPHTLTHIRYLEPTCTTVGHEQYDICRAEGCDYTTYVEIPVKPHTFVNYKYNDDATCVDDGTKTAICEVCEEAKDTVTVIGTKTGVHTYEDFKYNDDATCKKDGTKVVKCIYCDDEKTVVNVGSKNKVEHVFVNYVSNNDATCTKDGTKTAVCENCKISRHTVTDPGTQLAHTPGSEKVTKQPTCEKAGVSTVYCTVCKTILKETEIPTLDHVDTDRNKVCDNCGTKLTINNYEKPDEEHCTCVCHFKDKGFTRIVYIFRMIFWRIFNTNRTCECGIKHY